ncbi:FxSxx-COOH system tetratricopeptide repeat protein [Streptomyces sp. UH6]|uniref:FxSxx-COOH system tetratricopeptide repeat protein n=1 Tax=Streptomyces sp. UH6 TaxID=2748379 RepID=UPI00280B101A|nr:FxSxx-COOH system tetratricopeptide repeat protein [Streptomyces sp. UH6]
MSSAAGLSSYLPPRPNAPVQGREAELTLLEPPVRGRAGGLAVVCGAGGLGKTTLAAEAARRAQEAGRAVFWVRWQDDPGRLADDLTRIAEILGLPETAVTDAHNGRAVLVDTVWAHLAATRDWVIVIDNVDTPHRIGPGPDPVSAYRGWLRPDGAGLLVVTSRDTSPDTWGPRARLLPLKPLNHAAAGAVLQHHAPTAGTWEEAEALSTRLGGLPLALDTAGRYLARPTVRHRTFASYQHALEAEFGSLLGATHPQASDPDIARTVVRHTWDLSLTQLETDGYPLTRPLLHFLALFSPAPIPLSLITPALLTDAIGTHVNAAELDSAFAGLHQYGLLYTSTPTEGPDTSGVTQVTLHPLVRDVMALNPSGTDDTTALHALDTHLLHAANQAAQASRAGRTTARLLAAHLPPVLYRTTPADFTATRDTLDALVYTLHETGALTEQRQLLEHVLRAETCHLGLDHPDTLLSRNNLADTLRELGHYSEAVDLFREVLADQERVLGPDHPDTLSIRNNLATAISDLGGRQEAVALFREVLADQERVLGSDHPDTLLSRNNLADTLRELGHYSEAVDLLREVLADQERVLGPEHPETLNSRHSLADALCGLRRYSEAVDLLREVLADRERILGPDHPETLNSRHSLADALCGLRRYSEAVDLLREVLADRERILGPDHPETLNSRSKLAIAEAAEPSRLGPLGMRWRRNRRAV